MIADVAAKKQTLPKVSVILPAYNAEQYLAAAIESILGQTFTDFEFIIVDDGSTDRTGEIIRSYARVDARIRLLPNKRNLGIVESLNRGIRESRGIYIARMDHDDISLPRRLAVQVEFLDSRPSTALVASNVILIDEAGEAFGIRRLPESHEEIADLTVLGNQIVHPTVMIRKEALEEVRGYPKIAHAEDYALWIEMISHGMRLYTIQEPLVRYRKIDIQKITVKNKFRCGISTIGLKLRAWRKLPHNANPFRFSYALAKEFAWLFIDALLPTSVIYRIHRNRVRAIFSGTLPGEEGETGKQ